MTLDSRLIRSGLTLIELLIVIIILTTVVAAAIPLMTPTSAERRLREASRGLNAFISGAQMRSVELQRPYGVGFKRLGQDTGRGEDNGICLEVFYVEQPAPFVGFDETSSVMVAIDNSATGGVGQVLIRFVRRGIDQTRASDRLPLGWDPDEIPPYTIRPGDVVEVRGMQFILTDPNWDPDTGYYTDTSVPAAGTLESIPINDTGQQINVKYDDAGYSIGADRETTAPLARPAPYWTYPSRYKVLRQPMPASSEPFQLPEGTAIDLRASGEKIVISGNTMLGDFGGFFHNLDASLLVNNTAPVIVMFSPEGSIERVKFTGPNNEPFDEPVVSNIYFLIGRPENAPPPVIGPSHDPTLYADDMSGATEEQLREMKQTINWLAGESRWIVIGAQSGRVVTVENAFVDPRAILADPQINMGNPDVLRARQIQASREFARQMAQLGGR